MKNIHGVETGVVLRDEIRAALDKGESFPFFQVRMAKTHDICVRYQVWHSIAKESADTRTIEDLKAANAALENRLSKQRKRRNVSDCA